MKCRFAPSPTGKIHIGNARSAILNWIFCKKNNGEFVLRIDDTDTTRSSIEFEKSIKKSSNEFKQNSSLITPRILYEKLLTPIALGAGTWVPIFDVLPWLSGVVG